MFFRMVRDALGRVLAIGVDGQKLDTFGGKFLVQFVQTLQEEIVDGALGADEDQDDRFFVLELGQRNGLALSVFQGEVGNDLAELGAADWRVGAAVRRQR